MLGSRLSPRHAPGAPGRSRSRIRRGDNASVAMGPERARLQSPPPFAPLIRQAASMDRVLSVELDAERYLAPFHARRLPVYRFDVVVLGSGVGGASAALAAAAAGTSVALIAKDELRETNTHYAQGGVAAVLGADDTFDLHVADTLGRLRNLRGPRRRRSRRAGRTGGDRAPDSVGHALRPRRERHTGSIEGGWTQPAPDRSRGRRRDWNRDSARACGFRSLLIRTSRPSSRPSPST